jgi:hypothetical protein
VAAGAELGAARAHRDQLQAVKKGVGDKWLYPFLVPFILLYSAPIPDGLETRVLRVAGILALMVALLAVIQPWKEDL